ncbi:cohesin domain-containing protein [Patescibacteria group bacterium]|nr:cohesin domain-containing protein [Patescibacteria group bacterium]
MQPTRQFIRAYYRLNPLIRFLIWVGFLTVLVGIPAYLSIESPLFNRQAEKADFYFYAPGTDHLTAGDTFTVEFHVLSAQTSINAVGSTLLFDPHVLQITSLTTTQSFCSFYAENSFDNIRGEIHLSCGTPNPGYKGDSTLIIMSMQVKENGLTAISLKPGTGMILANDGKGTNLINSAPTLSLAIKQLL